MTDQVQNLAKELSDEEPTVMMRIAQITEIDPSVAKKVRTDQTGTAWIARSQDVRLAMSDRVWLVKQGATWIVGGRLSGSPSGPMVQQKTLAQSVTSSIVPVSDTNLAVPLTPGVYRVELFVHYSSTSSAANIRSLYAFSGSCVVNGRSCIGPGTVSTMVDGTAANSTRSSGHGGTTAVLYGTDGSGVAGVFHEDMLVTVTVTGVLQWLWAQGTSNAAATSVSSASRMYVTPQLAL